MTVSIPADELSVMGNLDGSRILEFGNKKNTTGEYRTYYIANGAQSYTSIDWNGQNGALPLDVNEPLDLIPCDLVTNFGFSEHVTNQESFWRNNHDLCAPGGVMCGVTPAPGFWPRHGILQPTEDFYWALAIANDYLVGTIKTYTERKRPTVIYKFCKDQPTRFIWKDHWLKLITPTQNPSDSALRHSRIAV